MKTKLTYLAASAAALVITTANLQAKDEPGFYAKVDAGGSLQQNLKLEGLDISFNPGFRGDIGFGYNFCKAFAAEFEAGTIWNSFDKVSGLPLAPRAEANLYQYPFLAKAIFKLPLENGLTPYIGVGAGGIGSTLHLKNSAIDVDEHSSDFTFAYEAEAGLKYAINEHIDVGVGYKFLGTTGYKFFNDPRSEDTFNHSIFASFTWNF